MLGYWREWYERAERGEYDNNFPPPDVGLPKPFGVQDRYTTDLIDLDGTPTSLFDLRKILITKARVVVSKKRTRNMLDLASLWKKQVLQRLNESVLTEPQVIPPRLPLPGAQEIQLAQRAEPSQTAWLRARRDSEGNINMHQRSRSEERDKPHFG